MFHWLHHLFNPHCVSCVEERQCRQCELLLTLLERERVDKNKLIEALVKKDEVSETPIIPVVEQTKEPVFRHLSWSARRVELERKDALQNPDKVKSIEELEETLLAEK